MKKLNLMLAYSCKGFRKSNRFNSCGKETQEVNRSEESSNGFNTDKMSEKQQTAVEWFHEQLLKGEFINDPEELLRQANELFEKQVIEAYACGVLNECSGTCVRSDQYYSKTYSK